ncbi:MAG: hypothetical protein ACRDUA_19630 [Micromonosporaceae bacterium]
MGRLSHGVLAGSVGTLALNAVTYLDMAVRGRPASRTPEQSVRALARHLDLDLGSGPGGDHRAEAAGALLGYTSGIAVGIGYAMVTGGKLNTPLAAVVLSGGALLVGNGPMTALGITDPRTWSTRDWLADVVPHLAYGVAAAYTYRLLQRP